MTTDVTVIDNFLSYEDFKNLQDVSIGEGIDWKRFDYVTHEDISEYNYTYMVHWIYDHWEIKTPIFHLVVPILNLLKADALIRAKINFYPWQGEKHFKHARHQDFKYKHKTAILGLNTCNGVTIIENEKINSVENRIIIFDGSRYHQSTTCTDQKYRMNLGIHYFTAEYENENSVNN